MKSYRRSALGISVLTLLSRIGGYIRDNLMARYLGTSHEADAFYIAFLIPNMLRRLVGEGSLTVTFIPVYTQWRQKDEDEGKRFASIAFTNFFYILLVITVLGILLAPILIRILAPGFLIVPGKYHLAVRLTQYMFPFIFWIGLAALSLALLNSHRIFLWPAAMPIFFNATVITIVLLFVHRFKHPSTAFAIGVVAGGALQFLLQTPYIRKIGFRIRFLPVFSHPGIQEMFRLMIPGFFSVGIAQINMAVGQVYASTLGEGAVSSLYYAGRIQELTIGVIAVAISTVLLPKLSHEVSLGKLNEYRRSMSDGFDWVLLWSLPATLGLLLYKDPIIHTLFEYGRFSAHSRALAVSALTWFALGVPAYCLNKVFIPGFYARKDMWTPVQASFVSMVGYVLGLTYFVPRYHVAGIAMSNACAAWLQIGYLSTMFHVKSAGLEWKYIFIRSIPTFGALILMVSIVFGIESFHPFVHGGHMIQRILELGWRIGLGGVIYFSGYMLLKKFVEE